MYLILNFTRILYNHANYISHCTFFTFLLKENQEVYRFHFHFISPNDIYVRIISKLNVATNCRFIHTEISVIISNMSI